MRKQCLFCNAFAKDGDLCLSCEFEPPKKIFPKQTCLYCGYDYTPERDDQPTCGFYECKKDHRTEPDYRKIERVCAVCPREFLPTERDQKVCSRFDCDGKWKKIEKERKLRRKRKKETKICPKCGCEFEKFGNQATCGSDTCKKEHEEKRKSASWRRGKHTRRVKLEQSGGTVKMPIVDWIQEQAGRCARCQLSIEDIEYHVHHIKPVSLGGDNSRGNLEALCVPCHHEVHRVMYREGIMSHENH